MTLDCDTLSLDQAARGIWDVAVIGAGPAGALAARLIAREGCRVLLIDKKPFPRPKVCGACVNGRALSVLDRAGLSHLISDLPAVPLNLFRLWHWGRQLPILLDAGFAVSREQFDAALVREAMAAGASFLPLTTASVGASVTGTRVVSLQRGGTRVELTSRVVLVADGLGHPSLSDQPEFRCRVARYSRIGAGCVLPHTSFDLPRGEIVMAVGRSGYVGMVRLEDGSVNVAAALDPIAVRENGLGPVALSALLDAGLPVRTGPPTVWRGTPLLTRRAAVIAGERLFLLGDAAGYVEPFTGEGIACALESASRVVPLTLQALDGWHDRLVLDWKRAHQLSIGQRQWLCRALSLGLRNSALLNVAAQIITFVPSVARRIAEHLNDPVPSREGCA